MKKRYRLDVAYDGSAYHGWQIQPNGITIEEVLDKNLSTLLDQEIKVQGASRTDAGVHALMNVCIFDANTTIPAKQIKPALQRLLPFDLSIIDSMEVDRSWHPRYVPSIKTYEYKIDYNSFLNPLLRTTHYYVPYALDLELMQKAKEVFVGEFDFALYCKSKSGAKTTVRTISGLDLHVDGTTLVFTITGYGFLYNMVRMIVGSLLLLGRGTITMKEIEQSLDTEFIKVEKKKDAKSIKTRFVAPAHGLTLKKIAFV